MPGQAPTMDENGIMHAPEPKVVSQANRDAFKQNFGFYGKYPLFQISQRNILVSCKIEGKKLDSIIKKLCYIFYDDGNHGFKVELVFEEVTTELVKCVIPRMISHEAILETFLIDKHLLAEIRRTFTTKTTI